MDFWIKILIILIVLIMLLEKNRLLDEIEKNQKEIENKAGSWPEDIPCDGKSSKVPVALLGDGPYDTKEECEGTGIDNAWQKVLASGQRFCKRWVKCEEDWPVIYVPDVTKEKACWCYQQKDGKWLAICSTAWEGHCECDVKVEARQQQLT